MSLFCLLWLPLFYLFWHSVTGNANSAGGVWALLAGSIVALFQFFFGPLIDPGGFGLWRWLSGFVDIVSVPVLLPLLIYLILVCAKIITGKIDFTNFALLWLIPVAAVRVVSWSSLADPILLVLVPVLWTAIAVGIPFFIGFCEDGRLYVIIPAVLGAAALPFLASCSYWTFYAQKTLFGFLFLAAAAAPMLISVILSFRRAEG